MKKRNMTSKGKLTKTKPIKAAATTPLASARHVNKNPEDMTDDDYIAKYPSPKTGPSNAIFQFVWETIIADVASRENFKRGHLLQVRVLCDLYQDYEDLTATIKREGLTYETEGGRNGPQIRKNPEVDQRARTISEIRSYSKQLGLVLVKDTNFTDPGEKEDSWS